MKVVYMEDYLENMLSQMAKDGYQSYAKQELYGKTRFLKLRSAKAIFKGVRYHLYLLRKFNYSWSDAIELAHKTYKEVSVGDWT